MDEQTTETMARCVVCARLYPRHDGLCCEHRYDEQPPCDRCALPATTDFAATVDRAQREATR